MINWSDVDPRYRSQYYAWLTQEHQVRRMGIPGFLQGRRYSAIKASRDILNIYEVTGLEALTGPEYTFQTSNPTELARQAGKWVSNAVRGLAHVKLSLGRGTGGFVMTLRFDAQPGREAQLEAHLRDALTEIIADAAVASAHLFVTDETTSSVVTPERRDRPTAVPRWIVMIEGISAEALERHREPGLTDATLDQKGARGPYVTDIYQLQAMVQKQEFEQ
jgi:hypothetical protein